MNIKTFTAALVFAFCFCVGVKAQTAKARDLFYNYQQESSGQSTGGNSGKLQTSLTKLRRNSPKPQAGKPGSKITIELNRDGTLMFVTPNYKFRSGDKIRLRFATNYYGYVAVFNLGSSGKVNHLYPYPGADNRVLPTKDYQIPKDGWIAFDNQPGTETLFVIMSREELSGMDRIEDEQQVRNIFNEYTKGKRDLIIQSQSEATYAVCSDEIKKPIGFSLELKHSGDAIEINQRAH